MQPFLPCNRVLTIQELQDLIKDQLDYSALKACSRVSRYWNSLFAPSVWRGFTVQYKKQRAIAIARRNGLYFQRLTLHTLDKNLLDSMPQHCPNIASLHIHFDHHSSRIQYPILCTFFSRTPTNLTSLYIHFDASLYPPSLLWSISHLTNLTRLDFDVFYSQYFDTKHHPPELYLSILHCCPKLQVLVGYGSFLEQLKRSIDYDKDSMSVRLKKAFVSRALDLPSNPPPAIHMNNGFDLRYLHLRSPAVDVPTFHRIITQSPLLERLSINYGYWNITSETWTILSAHCPKLQELHVWNSDAVDGLQLPDSTVLFYLFPKLKILGLNIVQFPESLDPSDLKYCRQRYEYTYDIQEPLPLRSLTITGPNKRAFTILLYALIAFPALESLTIGNTNLSQTSAQESSLPGYYNITEPWECQDSLTWLDLTFIHFPNQATLRQFFGHVERLVNLATLYVASSHFQTLMTAGGGIGPVLRLSIVFPTVTTLRLSPWLPESENVGAPSFMLVEACAVIDAFPGLKNMILLDGLGESLAGELSATYPTIDFAQW
ncbi:hypothetical protein BGW39_002276 [Mortierella sp. 14UC]|nr:hypothetical protein BGW39_002276 [Mortierella sp. 14UC]